MAAIKDKIPHPKIKAEMGKRSFSEKEFKILDELTSSSGIEIVENTLVIGDVTVDGTISLGEGRFFLVCGTLKATNLVTAYDCTILMDNFKITKLLNVAETDATTVCYADSEAKYILSGHDMGWLTADAAKITAEVIDEYVECINGAELDYESGSLIKTQFPDFISEEEWDNGDLAFYREKAPLLGIDNAENMDEDEICDLGWEKIDTLTEEIDVFVAADKIIGN